MPDVDKLVLTPEAIHAFVHAGLNFIFPESGLATKGALVARKGAIGATFTEVCVVYAQKQKRGGETIPAHCSEEAVLAVFYNESEGKLGIIVKCDRNYMEWAKTLADYYERQLANLLNEQGAWHETGLGFYVRIRPEIR